ncbi:hypothetical protein G6F66_015669 [Rhizopus arrhizus]|nr:hypothetical protein G6F66_015669 [Rhizopus arrhizus]KAG1244602.1 hypothetical protein G6F65_021707 [Rhizopus arrhizus]
MGALRRHDAGCGRHRRSLATQSGARRHLARCRGRGARVGAAGASTSRHAHGGTHARSAGASHHVRAQMRGLAGRVVPPS